MMSLFSTNPGGLLQIFHVMRCFTSKGEKRSTDIRHGGIQPQFLRCIAFLRNYQGKVDKLEKTFEPHGFPRLLTWPTLLEVQLRSLLFSSGRHLGTKDLFLSILRFASGFFSVSLLVFQGPQVLFELPLPFAPP